MNATEYLKSKGIEVPVKQKRRYRVFTRNGANVYVLINGTLQNQIGKWYVKRFVDKRIKELNMQRIKLLSCGHL